MPDCTSFQDRVRRTIESSIAVKNLLLTKTEILSTIAEVSARLVECLDKGNKLLLFGNGGSAADAQHIAAEFVGRFAFNRAPLPALALNVNTSCVTAIGNDYGFDLIFSRQVEALARRGDFAIGISTSGNSPNVLHGLAAARKIGLSTAGLTGCSGGKLKNVADYCICAPSDATPRIQECHILIGHIMSELVEEAIFHEQSRLPRS